MYLDAQADGLMAGITGVDHVDPAFSNRDSFSQAGKVVPSRQPSSKPIALHEARQGITSIIIELAKVKRQECDSLTNDLKAVEGYVEQIEAWRWRRQHLKERVDSLKGTRPGSEADALQDERRSLQQQIDAMMAAVNELKSQQRIIDRRLSELENAAESKSSSYKTSLSILDSEVESFLHDPPQFSSMVETEVGLLSDLPQSRRTLELAKEYLKALQVVETRRIDDAGREAHALESGARIWEEAVDGVTGFEAQLKEAMGNLRGNLGSGKIDAASDASDEKGNMRQILVIMQEVLERLETAFQEADKNGWTLLVCSIGAELEAFRQGHEILLQASAMSTDTEPIAASKPDLLQLDDVCIQEETPSRSSAEKPSSTPSDTEMNPESLLVSD